MNNSLTLRAALSTNAFFSATCAVFLVFSPERIATLMGVEPTLILRLVGLGLLIFAADLVHQATRPRMATWRALYASAADFAWVLATLVGLLVFSSALSSIGITILIGVALAVLVFGLWQLLGIDRAHRSTASGMHRHCVLVQVDTEPEAMWKVISQLDKIDQFMPTLRQSELLDDTPVGVGAVRRCSDHSGKTWSEECTDFQSGSGFTVRFLSEAPDFPYPARKMYGGWEVLPAQHGCTVKVWWELALQPRWAAPILLPVLAFKVDRDFPSVIGRMAIAASGNDLQAERETRPANRAQLIPEIC
jgi:hypothetical protein